MNQGMQKYGIKVIESTLKECSQLDNRRIFCPLHAHKLTKEQTMKLKISMERFSGEKSTIYYDMFKIADEVSTLK